MKITYRTGQCVKCQSGKAESRKQVLHFVLAFYSCLFISVVYAAENVSWWTMDIEWMAWTRPTAIFFVLIAAMLTFMIVWDVRSPPVMRKGFLPISTDRGDRLYIGLLGMAFINLLWLGFTDDSQWLALILCFVWLLILFRWG